ncbi:polyketide synthase dehydratase domain-containing protein, partial [Mycobacterium szulgai]|nr:polyketide synthase dehydratase domain-containing protein [Mycobacterium szulgai]
IHPRDDAGRRSVTVHTRASGDHHDGPWVLHASAMISAEQGRAPVVVVPSVVGVVDVEGFYQGLAAQGLGYAGPFQAV